MAITWPTASEKEKPDATKEKPDTAKEKSDATKAASGEAAGKSGEFAVGFVELPGSRQVYSASEQRWECGRRTSRCMFAFWELPAGWAW